MSLNRLELNLAVLPTPDLLLGLALQLERPDRDVELIDAIGREFADRNAPNRPIRIRGAQED